jgi:hypothetical protein
MSFESPGIGSNCNVAVSEPIGRIPMGITFCPKCGTLVREFKLVLGDYGASCRKCCWWRIEHPDDQVEEGAKPVVQTDVAPFLTRH